jgi:hypothetical protein
MSGITFSVDRGRSATRARPAFPRRHLRCLEWTRLGGIARTLSNPSFLVNPLGNTDEVTPTIWHRWESATAARAGAAIIDGSDQRALRGQLAGERPDVLGRSYDCATGEAWSAEEIATISNVLPIVQVAMSASPICRHCPGPVRLPINHGGYDAASDLSTAPCCANQAAQLRGVVPRCHTRRLGRMSIGLMPPPDVQGRMGRD